MLDFEIGDVVVFAPYGVGRIVRRSTSEPAFPQREVFVVEIDLPGLVIEEKHGGFAMKRVPQGQIAYVPVVDARDRLRRPPAPDEAARLFARLREPLPPAEAVFADRMRELAAALKGPLPDAIETLRRCYASTEELLFVPKSAMAALERLVLGEIAAGLDRAVEDLFADVGVARWR